MHNYRVQWLASELSKMIWVIYEYDMSDLWTMNWVNVWSQYNIKNKKSMWAAKIFKEMFGKNLSKPWWAINLSCYNCWQNGYNWS